MEHKSSLAEQWLDAFHDGRIDYDELVKKLEEAGINDINEVSSLHNSAVNVIQRYNVIQQVSNVHKRFANEFFLENEKKKKAPVVRMKFFLRIAAIFILIATSSAIFFLATTTQDRLIDSLSQEYHIQINRSQINEEISPIVAAFNSNNFAVVIYEYEKRINPSVREMFLGGYACLQMQRPEKAITIFRSILTQNKLTGKRLYQDEAEYYLLLSLIHDKQYREAHGVAAHIRSDHYHTYHTKITTWLLLKLKWLS